jgi:hypothetical protein
MYRERKPIYVQGYSGPRTDYFAEDKPIYVQGYSGSRTLAEVQKEKMELPYYVAGYSGPLVSAEDAVVRNSKESKEGDTRKPQMDPAHQSRR